MKTTWKPRETTMTCTCCDPIVFGHGQHIGHDQPATCDPIASGDGQFATGTLQAMQRLRWAAGQFSGLMREDGESCRRAG